MYDIEFAVPSDTSLLTIKRRLIDFKKFGLYNTENLSIHISFLASKDCGNEIEFLKKGWSENIVVDVINCNYSHVAQRICNYYASEAKKDFAKWYVRMDEDSITDVGGLFTNLQKNFDYKREYHIGARFLNDAFATDQMILKKLGYGFWYIENTTGLVSAPLHEQEIGITSLAAMNMVLENRMCSKYFNLRKEFAEGYGDHPLALACRMCKIYPCEAGFITYENLLSRHSIFGGHLNHVHWCSRDQNPKFFEWMELYNEEGYDLITNKIYLFGHESEKKMVEFTSDHKIKMYQESSYDNTLGLWCVKDDFLIILLDEEEDLIKFDLTSLKHDKFELVEV